MLSMGGEVVKATEALRNLGVTFDSTTVMHGQVNSIKRSAFYDLRSISKIRHFLDGDTCIKAVLSLLMSRLDCANALLAGIVACRQRMLPRSFRSPSVKQSLQDRTDIWRNVTI